MIDLEVLQCQARVYATLVLRERQNFGGRYAEVRAWSVPPSERYPDGIRYSFQYGTPDGETIFRYDNFPDDPGAAHHHKHVGDMVTDIEFDGLSALFRTFKQEVIEHGHNWD